MRPPMTPKSLAALERLAAGDGTLLVSHQLLRALIDKARGAGKSAGAA